jgi:FtsH-binding integral membrane protein
MSEALLNPYMGPVSMAPVDARSTFLRQVALKTAGSLSIVGVTATAASLGLVSLLVAGVALPWFVQLGVMVGGLYGSQWIGYSMIASPSAGTRIAGVTIGSAMLGVALSFVLVMAALVGISAYDEPLAALYLPFQALLLVGLTVVGMVGYLLVAPRNLSMVTAALSVLTLPMIALMVLTAVFPIGGLVGVLVSAAFVAISAGGLLVSLNRVIRELGVDQSTRAAFELTVGIVLLFWNILSLLSRLNNR